MTPGVHVHPYQHSPAQRSVPHCVTSSVSVCHPAGDSTPASVQPAKFKYTGNELLALAAPVGQRLKPELISTLKTLGIGRRLPRRQSCRGGARKVRAISVAGPSSVRSRDLSPTTKISATTVPASFCHHLPCPPSSPGCNPHNLVKIDTSPLTQELSRCFKVMLLNAQSVRNKTTDICDHVIQANVDLVFLCETWLRPEGDESDCAALTPPGFCLKSLPRMSGAGGGLAVLYRNSLTKNIAVSTRDFVFTTFEICEVRISHDSHTVVFLSVYRPPPSRKNKLTNAMFLEQFSDLLESYVSCDRLFVVGDLNVHFDNPSDPCTAALNVILGNLSLEQLVNVPTHRRSHTLDWLITNRSTDVLNLTVADMLLSDHFVISFDLLLRKPGRVTKKVTSRNIRSIDMHVFRTDLRNVLESTTQSDLADLLSAYNTCLPLLLLAQ